MRDRRGLRYLEMYLLDVIRGKKKGVLAALIRPFLLVASWGYGLGTFFRNFAFDRNWLCSYSPPVPLVISVGNIVAGGTGKTPVTLLLASEFYDKRCVAVLSRGYRSEAEKLPAPVWISKGQGPMLPASYCGDEPFLIAQNLPKAYVFVGKDRQKASNMAAKAGAEVVILDDAMQHRRLARDFEVVVIDGVEPFGFRHFLPRGLLREGLSSLKRADLLIINHLSDHEHFLEVKEKLRKYSQAPVIGVKIEVDAIKDFSGNDCEGIKGKKVGLFCGIAHPEYFNRTLKEKGAEVIDELIVADHMPFDLSVLEEFALKCKEKGCGLLICTEKDRVKFSSKLMLPLPAVWLKMRLEVVEEIEEWHRFIQKAKAVFPADKN